MKLILCFNLLKFSSVGLKTSIFLTYLELEETLFPGSPKGAGWGGQVSNEKVPSEMGVALRFKLLTLLFILFKLLYTDETVARMPIFIDGDGKNAKWNGLCIYEQNVW